eukprot:1156252-Pelagomonas_calceolata.AAC.4
MADARSVLSLLNSGFVHLRAHGFQLTFVMDAGKCLSQVYIFTRMREYAHQLLGLDCINVIFTMDRLRCPSPLLPPRAQCMLARVSAPHAAVLNHA